MTAKSRGGYGRHIYKYIVCTIYWHFHIGYNTLNIYNINIIRLYIHTITQ